MRIAKIVPLLPLMIHYFGMTNTLVLSIYLIIYRDIFGIIEIA